MLAGMRVTREKLIFLSLSILTKWSERAARGPITPDLSVRHALACVFTCGKSKDRRIYYEYWRLLSDPGSEATHESQRNYLRRSYTDSCIRGMILDAGAPMTPEYSQALSGAARKPPESTPKE